ncbi:hypothetical protein [Pseudomonas phage vB_Pae_CF213b]|nr:hypothetical protein [Pseudomonas phage vB_Pae_CF213b]
MESTVLTSSMWGGDCFDTCQKREE